MLCYTYSKTAEEAIDYRESRWPVPPSFVCESNLFRLMAPPQGGAACLPARPSRPTKARCGQEGGSILPPFVARSLIHRFACWQITPLAAIANSLKLS